MGEIYIIKNYVFPELFYIGKAKNGAAKRWNGSISRHIKYAKFFKTSLKMDNINQLALRLSLNFWILLFSAMGYTVGISAFIASVLTSIGVRVPNRS